MNFVILNVDLVVSTKLSMTFTLDRLILMIQAFNEEVSLIVKEFGGFVLKYVETFRLFPLPSFCEVLLLSFLYHYSSNLP